MQITINAQENKKILGNFQYGSTSELSIESKYRSSKKLPINEQSLSPFYIISLSTREMIVEGFLQPRIG